MSEIDVASIATVLLTEHLFWRVWAENLEHALYDKWQ